MAEQNSSTESTSVEGINSRNQNQTKSGNQNSRLKWVLSLVKRAIRTSWLYIIAAILFGIFIVWSGLPDAIPEVTSWDVANNAFRAYSQYLLLWASALLIVLSYLRGIFPPPFSDENDKQITSYKHETEFLLGRSDNLDKVLSYVRSGVSILTAVFTVIIAWLLDLSNDRILTSIELTLITSCSTLVVFGVISLLVSFGKTIVVANGWALDDSLLRTGQSDDIFIVQLTEVVRTKSDMINKIKDIIGFGLIVFIVVIGIGFFQQSYNSVQSFIEYPAVWTIGMLSYFGFLFLLVAFSSAAVSFLGIDTYVDITSLLENDKA